METKNRISYEAPAMEVLELETKGIICNSIPGEVTTTMDGSFTEVDM